MKTIKRRGFTVLELVIATAIFALIGIGVYEAYVGGMKQTNATGEALSAIQSATVLMEAIQQDVRQLAVLNEPNHPLIPYSIVFSTNGKSIMIRKGSMTSYTGEMVGSSFTIVAYQLVQHPTVPGAFTIRRVERNPAGALVTDPTMQGNDTVFRSLCLKDTKFDFLIRLEDAYSYRMFIRVSLTTQNTGADQDTSRLYFISNLFEAASPEFIHNSIGSVGFARRYLVDTKWTLGTNQVMPPSGYLAKLPPASMTEFQPLFHDYVDTAGNPQDVPPPPAAIVSDPFDEGAGGSPRDTLLQGAVEYLAKLVGSAPDSVFRGRILGQISSAAGETPAWVEPFGIDTTSSATTDVRTQLTELLGRIVPHGKEAVKEMCHIFGTHTCASQGYTIDDNDAQNVIANSYSAGACAP